ncbi:PadR family transcriptional regulator [Gaopeijia maritima]|uniref:PadR family transcriptional regulator n=1 Tax=Gaopeijia maritima TaxID=3119007 RepID=A0ABU9E3S1_9BACT
MPPDLPLLQGTLDVLILKALDGEPRHGYDVAAWIRARSGEALAVEDGALYTALHRMRKKGWIEGEWGRSENQRRAKFYHLTELGRERLRSEADSWDRYVAAVSRVLGA